MTTTTTTSFSLLNTLDYYLTDFWLDHGDPRAAQFPLMGTFKLPLLIYFTYYFLVLYLGPRLMRNRPPFSLKWVIIPYNLVMSLFNAYCFYRMLVGSRFGKDLISVHVSYQDPPEVAEENIRLTYLYCISKYVDMLDTLFFILRKKADQVTGLHVYHHSMVPLMAWIYFRIKVEHVTARAFGMLNTPIHTVMYAYYGLAAFGPQMTPFLWWKRYLTQLQIVQFVLLLTYGLYFAFFNQGYHPFFTWDVLLQTPLYLYLFTSFYLRSYKKVKFAKNGMPLKSSAKRKAK